MNIRFLLRINLIAILLIFYSISSFSQSNVGKMNTSSAPSPGAISISANNNHQVDLYTGKLVYNTILKEVNLSGIKIPVGLQYATTGFKVQEVASNVGLGWKTTFGGVINRYSEGLPDEQQNGYCGSNRIGGKNYASRNNEYYQKVTSGEWDSQPDKFYFSFLGFSGMFMLDPDGKPVLQTSDNSLKIEYSPFSRTNGRMVGGAERWILRDQQGNQYIFGEEFKETSFYTFNNPNSNSSRNYISSWYLKKIITNTNQTIDFNYISGSTLTYVNYVNVFRQSSIIGNCSFTSGTPTSGTWNENVSTAIYSPLYLSEIRSNGTSINLEYNHNRLDLTNGKALTNIYIKWKNKTCNKYSLGYGYFVSDGDLDSKRLKLEEIVENFPGVQGKYLYRFQYNLNENLPLRNSIKTDFWGYYNSNTGSSNIQGYLGGSKEPDEAKTKANVLVKAELITGSSIYFEYEGNKYNENNTNVSSGGLRVKEIYEKKDPSDTQKLNDEQYFYNTPNSTLSSGQVFTSLRNSELVVDFTMIAPNGSSFIYCYFKNNFYYSEPLVSISDNNNVDLGYSYVTIQKDDGSKKRYNFKNFNDYGDVFDERRFSTSNGNESSYTSTFNLRPQFPSTSYSFARGKIASQELIDKNGIPTQKTDYTYTLSPQTDLVVGIKAYAQNYVNSSISYYSLGVYNFFNQDLRLTGKIDTYYKNGIAIQTTGEAYTYTTYAKNLIKEQYKYGSNGRVDKLTYRYPFDIVPNPMSGQATINTPFNYMLQKNMIGSPIETIYSVSKDAQEKVMSSTLTRFNSSNNSVLPGIEYQMENKVPILPNLYQSYTITVNGSQEDDNLDSRIKPIVQYIYDTQGHIIQKSTATNPLKYQSNIWGYDGNYVIAEVDNAPYESIYHANFENGEVFSGIELDRNRQHTGKFSGKISNSSSSEVVVHSDRWLNISNTGQSTSPKKYTYSGWIYSDGPSAQLFLFMKRASETGYYSYIDDVSTSETGKWVFIQKEFDVPTDVTLLNLRLDNNGGGNVWFDDLHIYPSEAKMTTYTYEPLIGMTSKTDDRNITTYYEFDEFNRLKLVRDNSRNIIQSYCYNYRGESTNCLQVVSSVTKSGVFNKNNCDPGYSGTAVTYTVDAGSYTATSHAAADELAQNDVNLNGPLYANNMGQCEVQTIYARVELSNYSYYSQSTTANVEIKLYSDASCTVPLILTSDLDVRLDLNYYWYDQYGTSGPDGYSIYTISSGNSGINLGNWELSNYSYNYDSYYGWYSEGFEYNLSTGTSSTNSYVYEQTYSY